VGQGTPVIQFAGDVAGGKYTSRKWIGDVPDGGWYPMQNPDGSNRKDSKYAFIMRKHGQAQIFGPGRADGPFPEHYEPLECPVEKNPMNAQRINPVAAIYKTKADECLPVIPDIPMSPQPIGWWNTGRPV
jgi:formate dehydrogenase major subunit